MIQPTDSATHAVLVSYHGTAEAGLPHPQTTLAEVNAELREDEWSALVTGNGEWVPVQRMGRSRRPAAGSGASEDNR